MRQFGLVVGNNVPGHGLDDQLGNTRLDDFHPDSALGLLQEFDNLFAISFERDTKQRVVETRRWVPMRHWR